MGCARNEVDSEELAARLASDGWELVSAAERADIALVNTCGFVESAKKDSIDAILEATDGGKTPVVAVGCMAERYGKELATALPEASAVLGFDDYQNIAERLEHILAGGSHLSHVPRDRRTLLPISPSDRPVAAQDIQTPGHFSSISSPERRFLRKRLDGAPYAALKIASGCDRRCSFCAIPMFRGAFISRSPHDLIAEAHWLAENGVKEINLVSENSTSYGKDLGDLRLLESLLPALAQVEGIERIRVAYLQPAEMRPSLVDVMTSTPKVAPYFDLSFQHSNAGVLRNMRRFGDSDAFLKLIADIRSADPKAGIRSNVIVGFPGESESDFQELLDFLTKAEMDAVGVFGYSDEEGTTARALPDQIAEDVIRERVNRAGELVEIVVNAKAKSRIGQHDSVLIENVAGSTIEGRGLHQGPEVDGSVLIQDQIQVKPGDLIQVEYVESDGADLVARVLHG